MDDQTFDVIVAGGGPAGSTAALDLARRGYRVALVEQSSYNDFRVGETVPPEIRRLLTQLGVWEDFLATDPLPSYGIRTAWESPVPHHHDFMFNPYGPGYHIDRARFDAMLSSAAQRAGATLFTSSSLTLKLWGGLSGRRRPSGRRPDVGQALPPAHPSSHADTPPSDEFAAEVWGRMSILPPIANRRAGAKDDADAFTCYLRPKVGPPSHLSASFLIDATGRRSILSHKLGARAQVLDRLIAAVAVLPASADTQSTLIEAAENGWWYSAPLPGARTVFAYMTDADLWTPTRWRDFLNTAPLTSERAAASSVTVTADWPPPRVVSAATLIRRPLTGPNWLLAGDAAFAVDPLSGQGIYKSIESGLHSAAAIAGGPAAMIEYENRTLESFNSYLNVRQHFYRSVARWPESPFWQRRS